MANQPPYPVIVRNNQHYCVCIHAYKCAACGEVPRASKLSKAWRPDGLVLHRKRKLLKRTGTMTPEASMTALTLTTVPGPTKGNDTSTAVKRCPWWRLLVGEQVQFDLFLIALY